MRKGASENEDDVGNNGRAALLGTTALTLTVGSGSSVHPFLPGVMGFSGVNGESGSKSSRSPPCAEPGLFLSLESLCDVEDPGELSDGDLEGLRGLPFLLAMGVDLIWSTMTLVLEALRN